MFLYSPHLTFNVMIYRIVWLLLRKLTWFLNLNFQRVLWDICFVVVLVCKDLVDAVYLEFFSVYAFWQAIHSGKCSFFRRNEWVMLVWPIPILDCMSFFQKNLVFLFEEFQDSWQFFKCSWGFFEFFIEFPWIRNVYL